MAQVNARQWQRFSYRADVQLRWAAAEPAQSEHDALDGVCVNLGRGGMQVRADAAPDVGAAISCKFLFAGEWTTLPGRVRWRRTQPSAALANELGIEFGPLSARQNESVCELVASVEHGGRSIKLRVDALREPIDALATPTDRGLRVRAPLRLFAPGSELEVELSEAALKFSGRVVSAQLRARSGDERWELDMLIEDRQAPRSRRFTMYDTPAAPPDSRSLAVKRRVRADTVMIPRPGHWRVAAWWLTSLFATAVLVGLLAQLLAGSGRSPQHVVAAQQDRPAARHTPLAVLSAANPTVVSALAPSDSNPSTANHAALQPTPNESLSGPTRAPADSKTATAPAGAMTLAPDAVQYVAGEPTLKVSGDTSEIFVPVRGPLEGLRSALWVEPLALVIDLPGAEAALARPRYVLRAGGITQLSVGRNRGVTQLRVFLDALLARYSTQPVTGGLLIRLKRDLRPLPVH